MLLRVIRIHLLHICTFTNDNICLVYRESIQRKPLYDHHRHSRQTMKSGRQVDVVTPEARVLGHVRPSTVELDDILDRMTTEKMSRP